MTMSEMDARVNAGGALRGSDPVTASVWLDHAAVISADLDNAIGFYSDLIGLRVHVVEEDPIREGRRRAMFFDSQGRDVLEIIEMKEFDHGTVVGRGAIHHLGFRFPRADWDALRMRLYERGHHYSSVAGKLFVRDNDGLMLEIEPF